MKYQPLTIFGQMVVDHVVHTKHPYESANLKGIAMNWDPITGKIVIADNAIISTPCIMPPAAIRLAFELHSGEFKTGDKVDAKIVTALPFEEVATRFAGANLSQLGFPRQVPGGGGTNVSYTLYNIFGGIEKHYISVYSKNQNSVIEEALAPIFPPDGLLLIKEDPGYAVNIIIEGIAGDRFTVRSQRKRDILVPYKEQLGQFCMVNTCYNWSSAINGLVEVMRSDGGGVIACTESLCDDKPIPENIGKGLAEIVRAKLGEYNKPLIPSIRSFIRDVVMPNKDNIVYIFNEAELAHFLKETRASFDVLDLENDALFSGIIRGLVWLRGVQSGAKPEMIVTLGKHGALYLDKNDNLHYCRVMTDREIQRVAGEKNAIGDLFAAVVLGIVYGRSNQGIVDIFDTKGNRIAESYVPSCLIAASAAADTGIYDGFMGVTPINVNSLIQRKVTHYSFFGSIHNIDPADYAGKVGLVFERKMERLRVGVIKDPCPLNQLVDPNLLTV